MKKLNLAPILFVVSTSVFANTFQTPHVPISHCYHWLDENNGDRYLEYKYKHGDLKGGELTFHTTPGTSKGAIAGPGLYCAKSPQGSYSYGDRVIRVDLVDDIVMYDEYTGKKYCGHNGNMYSQDECDSKPWDIKFYSGGGIGNRAWYVISNPQAIKSWSANSSKLISDLNLNISLSNDSRFISHANQTINYINSERGSLGVKEYYNTTQRMNLVDIITNDPEKLLSIPALDNILRANAEKIETKLPQDIVQDFYKTQLKRIISDVKYTYEDIESMHKQSEYLTKVLPGSMKEAMEKGYNVNFSIINYYFKNNSKLLSFSQSELDSIFTDMIKTSSWKVSEAIKTIDSFSGFMKSKIEKQYISSLKKVILSNVNIVKEMKLVNIIEIGEFLEFENLTKDTNSSFRKTVMSNQIKKSNDIYKKYGAYYKLGSTKLYVDEYDNEIILNSCKLINGFSEGKQTLVYKADSLKLSAKLNKRSNSSVKSICEKMYSKIDTKSYEAACMIKPNGSSYSDYEYYGKIEGPTLDKVLDACKSKARSVHGVNSDSHLRDVETKTKGADRRYEAQCYADQGYNSKRDYNIGTLKANRLDQIITTCNTLAKAMTNSKGAIHSIESNKRQVDKVSGVCASQFSRSFRYSKRNLSIGELYAESVDGLIKSCGSLGMKTNGSSGVIVDVDFHESKAHEANCYMSSYTTANLNQMESSLYIYGDTDTELNNTCAAIQKSVYPSGSSIVKKF